MSEIFEIICEDCGNQVEIISPATLTCTKCGCGTHKFPTEMDFECFYKHKRRATVSAPCKECMNVERTMWRRFERVKSKSADPSHKKAEPQQKKPVEVKSKTTTTKTGIKRRKKK